MSSPLILYCPGPNFYILNKKIRSYGLLKDLSILIWMKKYNFFQILLSRILSALDLMIITWLAHRQNSFFYYDWKKILSSILMGIKGHKLLEKDIFQCLSLMIFRQSQMMLCDSVDYHCYCSMRSYKQIIALVRIYYFLGMQKRLYCCLYSEVFWSYLQKSYA